MTWLILPFISHELCLYHGQIRCKLSQFDIKGAIKTEYMQKSDTKTGSHVASDLSYNRNINLPVWGDCRRLGRCSGECSGRRSASRKRLGGQRMTAFHGSYGSQPPGPLISSPASKPITPHPAPACASLQGLSCCRSAAS